MYSILCTSKKKKLKWNEDTLKVRKYKNLQKYWELLMNIKKYKNTIKNYSIIFTMKLKYKNLNPAILSSER